jgi:hypothetical protein
MYRRVMKGFAWSLRVEKRMFVAADPWLEKAISDIKNPVSRNAAYEDMLKT